MSKLPLNDVKNKIISVLILPNGNIRKLSEISLKNKLDDINLYIHEYTNWLHISSTFKEKLYCIINDIYSYPKCPICGNDITRFHRFCNGYYRFCSKKCGVISKNRNIELTSIKKYGTLRPCQSIIVKNKITDTLLKNYGVKYPMQNLEILKKRQITYKEKTGYASPMQNPNVKKKSIETLLKKYNVDHISKCENIKNKKKITFRKHYWDTFIYTLKNKKNILPLFDKNEYINNKQLLYKCILCNNEFYSIGSNYQHITCQCAKTRFFSIEEKYIVQWLKSLNLNVDENNRILLNGLELDIYLPDYSLAIEYNGLYWHSELEKDKLYHLNKTNLCKEKGIQLIHIFENEWHNSKDIVKSIILSKLGIYNKRIFARKCSIKEISNQEYREFVELNHIQGYASAKYRIGLFYEDELYAVMSFNTSRFMRNEIELIRYCSKLNTQIIGGFSKILKYSNIQKITTYCDLRYSNAAGYIQNGFKLINIITPNYFYWNQKDMILENRQKYQKHKLKKLLRIYNASLTETENMHINGFIKIYDCGNLKLKYEKD